MKIVKLCNPEVTPVEKIKFTAARLNALEPPAERTSYSDSEVPGLQLRHSPSGAKVFSLYKRIKASGTTERITIGKYPEVTIETARKIAQELNQKIAAGLNPAELKRSLQKELTFAEFFEQYMTQWSKPFKRSWEQDQAKYDQYFATTLGKLKISAISPADIRSLTQKVAATKPVSANRNLALLNAIFNKAVEWDIVQSNPCKPIKKTPEKSRTRFLQADELAPFFKALEEEPNPILRAYFSLLFFTAARRANVLAMRWEQLDFTNNVWNIPTSKNGRPLTIPLIPQAIEVLNSLPKMGQWVFPSHGKTGHRVAPDKPWKQLLERAGIEDFHIHDARRSAASYMAIAGTSLPIIGAILGHQSQASTAIYARLHTGIGGSALADAANAMTKK